MGFLKAFSLTIMGLYSQKALMEQTLETTKIVYQHNERKFPHDNPHKWLVKTWLGRMRARGMDISDPGMEEKAYISTLIHACVNPDDCMRSLGLCFLYEETPMLMEKFSGYLEEYISIIGPVLEIFNRGEGNVLYKKYNFENIKLELIAKYQDTAVVSGLFANAY